MIAGLIELPALDLPGGGVTAGLSTADKQVRVLLRDLSGKSCWDASILYKTPDTVNPKQSQPNFLPVFEKGTFEHYAQPESFLMDTHIQAFPQRAMRHRPPNVLPEIFNAAPDLDQLDDVSIIKIPRLAHSNE